MAMTMPAARRVRMAAAWTISVMMALVALLIAFLVSLTEIAIPHLDLREVGFGGSDGKRAARNGRGLRRRESGETNDGGG